MVVARRVTVVVVGGGHSGLAMSKCLSERGIDHVVLERAEVANSWRTERWDSFTMLTPNWQARLPGLVYDGDDPDGFMTGTEIVAFVGAYAEMIGAPVEAGTAVTALRSVDDGYEVVTDRGTWRCRCVVLAGGACNLPSIPEFAAAVPSGVDQVNPLEYRNPDQFAEGGVLVIGAAATGLQLAEEIHRSGRPVTLSVGEHVRMPRTYRGLDIQHWMEVIGRLDERYNEVEDIAKARKVASPQLVGTRERRTLDLNSITGAGVQLRGRLGAIRDGVAMFSGGLRNHCALADQKLGRLLDDIDGWIDERGLDSEVGPAERYEPTRVARGAPLTLDLGGGEIRTIVWATGFRPDLSWVELPVFDPAGYLRHDGGVVVDAPGVYFLGGSFLRRRKSSFLLGAVDDSRELADHLTDYLATGV
ncbi:MAG: NAD(P)-binding domain-containing protein [Actinomycetota bacterium]|nr:NAD(P)-binding domain-containing protein [Actinomycetota bacterium]